MKKILSILLLIPILLIAGVLIVPSFVDWNKYKPEIQAQVKDKSGFALELKGDISLTILPMPTIKIKEVSVRNKGQELANLDAVYVSVALWPLLSKKIKVQEIELVHPTLNLVIDKTGKGNWENEILVASQEKPEENTTEETPSPLNDFSIDDFKITDGLLNFGNAKTGQHYKIEAVNIDSEIESLQGPFKGDVFFKYNGQSYDVSGAVESLEDMTKIPVEVELALDEDMAVASFKGHVDAEKQFTSGAFALKGSDISHYVGDKAQGAFSASGNVQYSASMVQLDNFSAELAGLKFEGVIINKADTITLNLKETTNQTGQGMLGSLLSGARANADIVMGDEAIEIPRYDIVVRGSALKGHGEYHFSKGVTLKLDAESLNVDEWMSLAGQAGLSKDLSSKEGVKPSKDLGFSLPMNSDIKVNLGALIYQEKTYKNVRVDVVGKKKSLLIKKIAVNADYDTEIVLKGKIEDTQKLTGLDLKASLKTANADALLKSLEVNRDAYPSKIGTLKIDGAVKGSLQDMGFSTKLRNKGLTLTASGHAKDPLGTRVLSDLNIRVQHANFVNAVQMAQPDFSMDRAWQKPLDLKVGVSYAGETLSITSLKGKAGLIPIESGAITIQTGGAIPSLSGKLALGALVFPQARTNSSRSSSQSTAKGSKWSNTPIETAWMNSVAVNLELKAKKIVQNKWVFNNPSLDFVVKDGALTISALKADMFNGTALVSGKIVSGQNGKGFSSVQFKADTKNLNAQSLYSAIKGKNTNMITGAIVQASENITTQGISMASLVNNLKGEARLRGERIVINGVDITSFVRAINGDFKGLNSLSDISNSVLYKGKTEFDTLTGQFDISQGVVKLNPVTLDGPKARFDVTGNLDLPKWTIDINNKVSPKGADIESFDMSFRGSLDNPVKSAGGGALENLVQRRLKGLLKDKGIADKLNKKLGIDLFGSAQKESQAEPAAGEETSNNPAKPTDAEDALKNALGGLLKGL